MGRWSSATSLIVVTCVLANVSQAQQTPPSAGALPPETRVTVAELQAMSAPERAAYLAGVADGMGVAHLRQPKAEGLLATCLKGYKPEQLADAYVRQRANGPVARLAGDDSAALQFMLAMIGECQLQGTPR